MRLLHTSDWHLGRSFHRENLIPAQRSFLTDLLRMVRAEEVDAVLVSGDVYDRAIPGLEAVELFDETLHSLAELGVPTMFISGNHDSARRFGVGAALLDRAGVHVRTDPATCATPVIWEDAHGPVACYGLPYLEPVLVREELGAAAASHEDVLRAAMDRVRADLAERPSGTRSVVLAHAFVTGGEASASERDITVGGVPSAPINVFDGVDYVALGHLHGCQTLSDRVRYSGSPLAYSFSEAAHRKSVWLIDLDAAGAVQAERRDCPAPRPLARVQGRLEELLADTALAERYAGHWLQVTLTDSARPPDAMERLRQRFPHTLVLLFDPEQTAPNEQQDYTHRLAGRADFDVGLGFVEHVRGTPPEQSERALLREAFEAARRGEEDSATESGKETGR